MKDDIEITLSALTVISGILTGLGYVFSDILFSYALIGLIGFFLLNCVYNFIKYVNS